MASSFLLLHCPVRTVIGTFALNIFPDRVKFFASQHLNLPQHDVDWRQIHISCSDCFVIWPLYKLELDERIIRSGCENDQRFRIHAWRQDPESSARWDGVEYEIRPREKTATTLTGSWDNADQITLSGKTNPGPGGGVVSIRIDFDNAQPNWVSVNATAAGVFTWTGPAHAGSRVITAVARFQGNQKFGSSVSNEVRLTAFPIVN